MHGVTLGQTEAASVQWPLTSGAASKIPTGNITAENHVFGSGLTNTGYTGLGARGDNWNPVSMDDNDYHQYSISTTSGKNLTVTQIYLYQQGFVNGNAAIYYSTDLSNFNTTRTLIGTFTINSTKTTETFSGLSINANYGETLYIRVYGWGATNPTDYFYNQNFTIEGTTTTPSPTLSVDPMGLIDFGEVCQNATAGPEKVRIIGTYLNIENINVGPLNCYTFSTNADGTYASSLSLTQSGGTYSQDIFIKFTPTVGGLYYNGDIPVIGGGTLTYITVTGYCKGVPSRATNPIPANGATGVSYAGLDAVSSVSWDAVSDATSYDVYFGTGSIPGTPTATDVAINSYSTGVLSGGTKYYWKVVPKNECGATSAIPVIWTFTTVTPPTITVSAASLDFGALCVNSGWSEKSYTVSGTSLTGPIEITPPSGFEISAQGGASFNPGSILRLNPSNGTLSDIPIYIRFVPTTSQAYSGNITHNSTGATTKNIAVTGNGKAVPSTATNPSPANGASGVCYAGSGLVSSVSWNAVSEATSYDVYFGAGSLTTSFTTVNTNSFSTGSLSAGTTYHWKVVPKNDCGATAGTPVEWTFTTNDFLCYCKPSSNSTSTYINAFSATGSGTSNISNNATGYTSPGYADYSASQYVSQYANNQINWSLTFVTPGGVRPAGFSLWVDWDKNGFGSGDNVYITSSAQSQGTYTGSFTVPSDQAPGNYRMRVFVDAVNGIPNDPCNFAYYYYYGNVYLGEAEDYTVSVTEGSCTPPVPTFTALPTSPQCTDVSVTYTTQDGKTNYIWSIPGTEHTDYEITSGGTSSNTVTLTWLTAGSKTVTVNYMEVCQGVVPASSTITVNQQPWADADEDAVACGLSFMLNATPSVGTGTWTKESGTGNASFDENANDPDATVTVDEYGTYVFRWTEVNGLCSDYAEVTVNFNLQPTPTFTASPTSPQIAGDAVTYTTQASKTNYVWNIPGTLLTDYKIGSGGTSSDNTVTLTWLTAGSKTVTVNYSEVCQGATPASSTITVVSYCKPSSNSTSTYINAFSATGSGTSNILNNATGYTSPGYADYSASQSVSQYANNQINWSLTFVTPSGGGTTRLAGFTIWVDWDKDGFDSGEKVYTTSSAQMPGTYTGSFQVPSGQAPGNYRMRVFVDAVNGLPNDPCNFAYYEYLGKQYLGEAEDYTVTVTESSCTPPTPTFTESPSSPNCTSTQLTYTTQADKTDYVWSIPGEENTDYLIISGGTSFNTITLMWLTAGSKTVTVNYTEICQGITPASSSIIISPPPTATISYDGSPYCRTGIASVTLNGPAGGTFERMSRLSINTVTGEINLATSAAGSYYVSYRFTGENGCTGMAITLVEIKALPSVSITGLTEIKAGETTTLSPTSGGNWVSNNEDVATVTDEGLVTGKSAGTATFTFTDATTDCSATTAVVTVVKNASQTFTSSGEFKVPDGVYSITIKAWGGGGGGSYRYTDLENIIYGPGAGGGGGGFCGGIINVTPGDILDIIVGTGGYGGNDHDIEGSMGGESEVRDNSGTWWITAFGGSGGFIGSLGAEAGSGGNGSYYPTTLNFTTYNGGNGSVGILSENVVGYGGGGGGGAGDSQNGSDAINETGGAGGNNFGGKGGDYGSDGFAYGGGGGGNNNEENSSSGNGANGAVIIEWSEGTCTPPAPTFTESPTSPQCIDGEVTYTTQADKTSYVWNIPGIENTDYEISSGGSSSDNTVTLIWLTAGNKTVTVNYTEVCQGVTPASSTITVNQQPTFSSISIDPSVVCINEGITITIEGLLDGINTVNVDMTYEGTTIEDKEGPVTPNNGIYSGIDYPSAAGDYSMKINSITVDGCTTVLTENNEVSWTVLPDAAVASVTGVSKLCIGGTYTFTADGAVLGGGTGTWSSSDKNVATVDDNGLVTAVAAGTCDITYTITGGCNHDPVSASKTLIVKPLPTVEAGDDQTVCADENMIKMAGYGVGGGATTGEWTGGDGIWENSDVYLPTPEEKADGKVVLTYWTNDAYPCDVSDYITVFFNPLPATLELTGSEVCAGVPSTITSTTSETGVNYQLYIYDDELYEDFAVGDPQSGTGLGLTWSGISAGMYYYVIGTNTTTLCRSAESNNVSVIINRLPATLELTGSEVCQGVTTTITSTTSDKVYFYYQLYIYDEEEGKEVAVGDPKNGTLAGLTWSGIPAGTGYYVIGTNSYTGCSSASNKVDVVINPLPAALALTGSEVCAGVTSTITSTTSETGVNYQLYLYDDQLFKEIAVGDPQSGTGFGLTWSGISTGLGYYVIGTNTTTLCKSAQSNSVDVIINRLPEALVLTGSEVCQGVTTTITSTTSDKVYFYYQLYIYDEGEGKEVVVGGPKNGTLAGLTWSGIPAGTGYYVIGTNSYTGCSSASNKVDVVKVNTAPIFTACPGNISQNTDANVCTAVVTYTATATGTPTPDITYSFNGATTASGSGTGSGSTFNKGTTNVEITATNSCGHVHCNFTVTVNDNQAPAVAVNGGTTVACIAAASPPTVPSATDVCDGSIVGVLVSKVDNPDPLTCEGTRVYTYSYTDAASNVAYWTYTYLIDHTTAPAEVGSHVSVARTVECFSDATAPTTLPVMKDVCGNLVTPTGGLTTEGTYDGCEGTVIYRYTYTDACDGTLSTDWVYTYTINRTIAPVMVSNPEKPSSTVECVADAVAPTIPTFKDVCGNLVTPTGGLTTEGTYAGCEGTVIYRYTFTDACDGTLSTDWVYTYTINRTIAPVMVSNPEKPSSTVECVADAVAPTIPTFKEVCGNLVTPTGGLTTEGTYAGCEGTVIYRYTFTDACDGTLSTDWVYTYTIDRITAPAEVAEVGEKAEIASTVECVADAVAPTLPVVKDICGATVLNPALDKTGSFTNCEGWIKYTYTYTDCAGLQFVWTYTYNVKRTTAPAEVTEVGEEAEIASSVECVADAVAPTLPVVKDVCGATVSNPALDKTGSFTNCEGWIKYTYTYTDCADLQFVWTYTYTIDDKTPPTVLTKPVTVTLDLNGNTSITVADINNGSSDNCNGALTYRLSQSAFTCLDVPSKTVTLYAKDCALNEGSNTAVVTINQRATKLVINTLFLAGEYSDPVSLKATLTDLATGTKLSGKTVNFQIGTQTATGTTDVNGIATASITLSQGPGAYTLTASYAAGCPFMASSATKPFVIVQERACATYTGVLTASTGSVNSSKATLLLSATVVAAIDGNTGDIRNALVSFLANGVLIKQLPVGLITQGDIAVGSASTEYTYDLGTQQGATVTISVWISGYYRNMLSLDCFDITEVTISKPGTDFITGGGYLVLEPGKHVGTVGADSYSKNNFGFNVKYNKKGTNLQGNINTIVRKTQSDYNTDLNVYENVVHKIQIKGTALTSLAISNAINGEFTGKAVAQDVTDPTNVVSLGGNLVMKVLMTDNGEPGSKDLLSMTVFDKDGGVLFSSRWENNQPVKQLLAAGNLQVNPSGLKSVEITTAETPVYTDEPTLKVYPNPFSEKLNFEFVSPTNTDVILDILDATGRKVKTIFEGPVEGGVLNSAEFVPATSLTGLYIYQLTMGKNVFVGKVIYKE